MADERSCEDLPYQPEGFDNPTYILPDFSIKEELLYVEGVTCHRATTPIAAPGTRQSLLQSCMDPLYQAVNLENAAGIVPMQDIKYEFVNIKDIPNEPLNLESASEMLPRLAVKEEVLDINEEAGMLHPMVENGDYADEYTTDNKNFKLRDWSNEDLMSSCDQETVDNSTGLHNTLTSDSGKELSLNVTPSSLSDCKIGSAHEYSRETVNKRFGKNTVHSTGNEMRQYDIFTSSEETLSSHENKLNICNTCHKGFISKNNLKRHIRIHTASKPYTCDSCHKCFRSLSALESHIRVHTGSKPYTCEICNKCFSQASTLKKHILIHTGSKPFTCDTCHKCFRSLSNLKQHIIIHIGEKPYICDTCHKCFKSLSELKTHKRIHKGIKPYTCETCHKCFSRLYSLKEHIRIHFGGSPYNCDICHKSFSRVSILETHYRIHTNSKPFICDTCHKCFRSVSALKLHIRLHTGVNHTIVRPVMKSSQSSMYLQKP